MRALADLFDKGEHAKTEFAECPACDKAAIPVPSGFGILFRTARCGACGESLGKWRDFVDEDFEVPI